MPAQDGEYWTTGAASGVDDRTVQWQEMLSATHLSWSVSVTPEDRSFEAWVRRWWIDDLALVECECSPCSGTRQRRHLADTDGEFVVVLMTLSGRETVSQGDVEAAMRPGDAVVWDSTKPARFTVWEPLAKRSLLIPRRALEEVRGGSAVVTGVSLERDSPATRLLSSYLDTLSATLPELGPAAVGAARNATLELLMGALRADEDAPSMAAVQPALRAAMDRFIERHLLDGSITPNALAAAHGVSVRTVNRIFNASGQTVGEVIRVRRLARAREDLGDSDLPISAIAHRWGFSDAAHFSRSFRTRYGTSPTEYRHSARGGASVQRAVAGVQGVGRGRRETGFTAARG